MIFTRLLTREQVHTSLRRQPFRLWPFLARLAVVRCLSDVAFYGVHRLLHTPLLYKALHKVC